MVRTIFYSAERPQERLLEQDSLSTTKIQKKLCFLASAGQFLCNKLILAQFFVSYKTHPLCFPLVLLTSPLPFPLFLLTFPPLFPSPDWRFSWRPPRPRPPGNLRKVSPVSLFSSLEVVSRG
jgi:hypothetical protein